MGGGQEREGLGSAAPEMAVSQERPAFWHSGVFYPLASQEVVCEHARVDHGLLSRALADPGQWILPTVRNCEDLQPISGRAEHQRLWEEHG